VNAPVVIAGTVTSKPAININKAKRTSRYPDVWQMRMGRRTLAKAAARGRTIGRIVTIPTRILDRPI
jgi:hypothetical protein